MTPILSSPLRHSPLEGLRRRGARSRSARRTCTGTDPWPASRKQFCPHVRGTFFRRGRGDDRADPLSGAACCSAQRTKCSSAPPLPRALEDAGPCARDADAASRGGQVQVRMSASLAEQRRNVLPTTARLPQWPSREEMGIWVIRPPPGHSNGLVIVTRSLALEGRFYSL